MGRLARVVAAGYPHHITQRGNHQQKVFFCDEDRSVYLEALRQNCSKFRLTVIGYCLMSNHVHLVAIPENEQSLAKALGRTHNDYARWQHMRQHQAGHLWQNRFYSCPLGRRHCWDALRYVELNPVRAGMVARAWDWEWSSARAHLIGDDPRNLLDLALWSEDWEAGGWRAALELGIRDAETLQRLRQATRTGRPFAEASFIDRLEQETGRDLKRRKPGPPPGQAAAGSSEVV